jgi:hypothetical protein
MATARDYETGAIAALTVVNADIEKDVPSFFQDEISDAEKQQIAAEVAKAVIDAVDKDRANLPPGQSTQAPKS